MTTMKEIRKKMKLEHWIGGGEFYDKLRPEYGRLYRDSCFFQKKL
jgi:hypothetical protein